MLFSFVLRRVRLKGFCAIPFGVQECMPDNHVKPKVLVVDDERVIADTLAMILEPERLSGKGRLLR